MILSSIPEEFFLVMTTLIVMKKYEYLDEEKLSKNLKKIFFTVVLPLVIIASLTLHFWKIHDNIRIVINLLSMIILICIFLKTKKVITVAMYSLLSLVFFTVTQLITFFIVVYVMDAESYMNRTALLNFILFLPERIIQYGLLYTIYLKENTDYKTDIYKTWQENKSLKLAIILLTLINITICLVVSNVFIKEHALLALPKTVQIIITILIFIMIILNLIAPWVLLLSKDKNKENRW